MIPKHFIIKWSVLLNFPMKKKYVVFLSSLSVACYRFILNYNLQNRSGFNVSRLSDLDRLSRSVEILRSYIKINVSVSVNDAEQLLQSRNVFEIEKHQLTLRFLLGFFLKTAFLNLKSYSTTFMKTCTFFSNHDKCIY